MSVENKTKLTFGKIIVILNDSSLNNLWANNHVVWNRTVN